MASAAMQPGTRGQAPGPRLDRSTDSLRDAAGQKLTAAADNSAEYSETCERLGREKADRLLSGTRLDQMMSGMINEIVGGIFAIALGLVLLNQLFAVSIVDTANGSFAGTFDTVESVGGAAIIFAVLGMLALAGGTAVRMFRT
jgi:hypothetical protein